MPPPPPSSAHILHICHFGLSLHVLTFAHVRQIDSKKKFALPIAFVKNIA